MASPPPPLTGAEVGEWDHRREWRLLRQDLGANAALPGPLKVAVLGANTFNRIAVFVYGETGRLASFHSGLPCLSLSAGRCQSRTRIIGQARPGLNSKFRTVPGATRKSQVFAVTIG